MTRILRLFIALAVAGCTTHARGPALTQELVVTGVGAVPAAGNRVALLFDIRNESGQTAVVFQDVTRVVVFGRDGRVGEPLIDVEGTQTAKLNLEAECGFRSHVVLAPGATTRLVTYVSSNLEAGDMFKATATTTLLDLRCTRVLPSLATRTFELETLR